MTNRRLPIGRMFDQRDAVLFRRQLPYRVRRLSRLRNEIAGQQGFCDHAKLTILAA
jgi:hypothetical protein